MLYISRRTWQVGILGFILSLTMNLLLLGCTPSAPSTTTSSSAGNISSSSSSPSPQSTSPAIPILVGAAASLQEALKDITPLYVQARAEQKMASQQVDYNFAASGAIQQQIEQGAPIDVFISAATKQMANLQQKDLLLAGTQRNLLTNQLVLITPQQSSVTLTDFSQLVNPEVTRIAIGEPRTVPAGQYGAEVLKKLGIFEQVESKFVLGNNVKSVLAAVAAGEVEAGIVYLSDAKNSPQVKIASIAAPELHTPIVYPIAILKTSKNPTAAVDYANFLETLPAQKVFEKYGFGTTKS